MCRLGHDMRAHTQPPDASPGRVRIVGTLSTTSWLLLIWGILACPCNAPWQWGPATFWIGYGPTLLFAGASLVAYCAFQARKVKQSRLPALWAVGAMLVVLALYFGPAYE